MTQRQVGAFREDCVTVGGEQQGRRGWVFAGQPSIDVVQAVDAGVDQAAGAEAAEDVIGPHQFAKRWRRDLLNQHR